MIKERDFLSALQLSEAMGNAKTLELGLEQYKALAKSDDPAVQEELKRLRLVRDNWIKIEREHGPGSLLNLGHPLVEKNRGYGIIDEKRITNALRYSEFASSRALAGSS
ncbi:hypothetical protein [Rhodopseudomonas palustris]|uniref:hypothetical protein n=1 Tax=Rhodopseudomonas palustris TaxID=1076 RepID=UPI0006420E52|nr:hypothetical protein [Rhodopseudomonas palustris]